MQLYYQVHQFNKYSISMIKLLISVKNTIENWRINFMAINRTLKINDL